MLAPSIEPVKACGYGVHMDGARLANTHAAGDRSVKLVLNNMEEFQGKYGKDSTKNWALDHCRLVDPTDMARAAIAEPITGK